ncbi:hypothetical protein [Variovorax paradoxus]|uniref:Tetratricopeptide repeat n=1 Tax=Variovorax paradoxus (strain EPS) TaxID=595537 RepID=E6V559_VARPE|nr:hypothetical protein [Variovorax paradoxus]ADU39313.1 Tetratricopeptide repeat [Variovorax paradoxus EPS]
MKKRGLPPLRAAIHPMVARRIAACAAATVLALATIGCANVKDQYAASADAQQRQAAEAATDTRASANVDTQATYLRLVEQMQQEGLWFASLAHIDALEQRWGVSPESNRMRGDALRQTGQAAMSEDAYKRLMGTPLEAAGYRGLGLLAGARGDYTLAVQMLKQAQRRTPTDALLLSDLGYASLRAGLMSEARLPLMQALQLKPDSQQAQANLALYLELSGQTAQANSLMETSRMPAATRAGVVEAARQLRSGQPAVFASTITQPFSLASGSQNSPTRTDETEAAPLALKASRWSGVGGTRSIGRLNPPQADLGPASLSSPTSQGTQ